MRLLEKNPPAVSNEGVLDFAASLERVIDIEIHCSLPNFGNQAEEGGRGVDNAMVRKLGIPGILGKHVEMWRIELEKLCAQSVHQPSCDGDWNNMRLQKGGKLWMFAISSGSARVRLAASVMFDYSQAPPPPPHTPPLLSDPFWYRRALDDASQEKQQL